MIDLLIVFLKMLFIDGVFLSKVLASFFAILFFAFFLINALLLLFLLIKKKVQRKSLVVLSLLLSIYLLTSIWKLPFYFDYKDFHVTPELVQELETDQPIYSKTVLVYRVSRYPFVLNANDSQSEIYYAEDSATNQRILDSVQDTKNYTYIISFGKRITSITLNHWDSFEALPAPWNGAILYMSFSETSFENCKIYIYRIPAIPVSYGR